MRLVPMRVLAHLVRVGLLVLVTAGAAAEGEIYRWTDAEGRMHFTERIDQVPPAYREQARRNAARAAAREVQIYTAPGSEGASPPAAPSRSASRGEIEVPFVRMGSLMRVDAVLNETTRAPFLVDTGASGVSIPSAVAEQLGLSIGPDTPEVHVQTANGVVALPVVTLRSVQIGEARVENLSATVNPSMQVGLLGGSFFNHFVYRIDAAAGTIALAPNENLRGGLGKKEWRERFRALRDPLERLEAHLESLHPDLRQGERERLARRRDVLKSRLADLERQANRLDVPQQWRE